MFVIIVGGGRTGSHLVRLLLEGRHEVKVIDDRPELIERLQAELPQFAVVTGDGSDPLTLQDAGVKRAQVVAAVTASDEANLVVTSLAKFEFKVPRVIARINDPRNAWLFTPEMGVDVALNAADVLGRLIEEEMSLGDMMTLLKLRRGQFSLVEEKLPPDSRAVGVMIKDLRLPEHCVIASIIRRGELIIPRGVTALEAGDEVLAVVDDTSAPQLAELFGGETPLR